MRQMPVALLSVVSLPFRAVDKDVGPFAVLPD